ncbi:MAG: foldase protein PrsA [Bacillota bacterium]
MKVLSLNERDISLQELIQIIRSKGKTGLILQLVQQAIIEDYSAQNNITATTEELQDWFDTFRKRQGLFSAAETENWMKDNYLTIDDLEKEAEISVLSGKITDSFPKDVVEKYFVENKVNMDAVELYMLTVNEKEVAMELLAQIKEDGMDFMLLAREYSTDERAKLGGYLGTIRRPNLQGNIAAAVFGAKPGDVVGPFETEAGHTLFQVSAIYPAVLDEQKEKEIRNNLFLRLLAEQEQKICINWAV